MYIGGFVVRAYYENNHSVIATQRAFRIHFGIPRAESVPSANTVWCAVSQFGVIGPYFFEDENRTVTVTSARHVVMLETHLQRRS